MDPQDHEWSLLQSAESPVQIPSSTPSFASEDARTAQDSSAPFSSSYDYETEWRAIQESFESSLGYLESSSPLSSPPLFDATPGPSSHASSLLPAPTFGPTFGAWDFPLPPTTLSLPTSPAPSPRPSTASSGGFRTTSLPEIDTTSFIYPSPRPSISSSSAPSPPPIPTPHRRSTFAIPAPPSRTSSQPPPTLIPIHSNPNLSALAQHDHLPRRIASLPSLPSHRRPRTTPPPPLPLPLMQPTREALATYFPSFSPTRERFRPPARPSPSSHPLHPPPHRPSSTTSSAAYPSSTSTASIPVVFPSVLRHPDTTPPSSPPRSSSTSPGKRAAPVRFVNYDGRDKELLLSGVAASGGRGSPQSGKKSKKI